MRHAPVLFSMRILVVASTLVVSLPGRVVAQSDPFEFQSPFALAAEPERGAIRPFGAEAFDEVTILVPELQEIVRAYPESMAPNADLNRTLELEELFVRVERMVAAGRMLTAVQVADRESARPRGGSSDEQKHRARVDSTLVSLLSESVRHFDGALPQELGRGALNAIRDRLRNRYGTADWRVVELSRLAGHAFVRGNFDAAQLRQFQALRRRHPENIHEADRIRLELKTLCGQDDLQSVRQLERLVDGTWEFDYAIPVTEWLAASSLSNSSFVETFVEPGSEPADDPDAPGATVRHSWHRELLDSVRRNWGPRHPCYAAQLVRMAAFYDFKGEQSQCDQYLVASLDALQPSSSADIVVLARLYGIDVDQLCEGIVRRALGRQEAGNFAQCRSLLQKVLNFQREFYGSSAWEPRLTFEFLRTAERLSTLNPAERDALTTAAAQLDDAIDVPEYLRDLCRPLQFELDGSPQFGQDADSDTAESILPTDELGFKLSVIDEIARVRSQLLRPDAIYRARLMCLKGALLDEHNQLVAAFNAYRDALLIFDAAFGLEYPDRSVILERLLAVGERKVQMCLEDGTPEQLKNARDELAQTRSRLLGSYHWAVSDERRAQKEQAQKAGLPDDQLAQLEEMDRLAEQVANFQSALDSGGMFALDELSVEEPIDGPQPPSPFFEFPADAAPAPPAEARRITTLRSALNAAEKVRRVRCQILGNDHSSVDAAVLQLAALNEAAGNLDRADENYLDVQNACVARVGKLHPLVPQCLEGRAALHDTLGNVETAEELRVQAEVIRRRIGFRIELRPEARTRSKLLAGDFQEGDLPRLQAVFSDYFDQANFVEAMIVGRQILDLAKRLFGERHREYAICLANLANVDNELGDYSRARLYYARADEILSRLPLDREYAKTLHNRAVLLERLEQFDEAVRLLERELAILDQIGDLDVVNRAHSLTTLTTVEHRRGNLGNAAQAIHKALTALESNNAAGDPVYRLALVERAFVATAQGDFAQAAEALQRAEQLVRDEDRGNDEFALILFHRAILHEVQGGSQEAARLFEQSLDITRQNLERATIVQSPRQQMAMASSLRTRLDAYLSLATRAALPPQEVYEQLVAWKGTALLRREELLARANDPQTRAIAEDVANVSNELAGLILAAATESAGASDDDDPQLLEAPAPFDDASTPDSVPVAEPSAAERITELTRTKEELEERLSKHWFGLRAGPAPIDIPLRQIRAAIPTDVALIDFVRYRHVVWEPIGTGERGAHDRYMAFIIRRDGPIQRVDLQHAPPIDSAVINWRNRFARVTRESADPVDHPQRVLRSLVWDRLKPHLRRGEAVIICPDGDLAKFPFAAMPGDGDGTYLIEERPVAMLPAPEFLVSPEVRIKAPGGNSSDFVTSADEDNSAPRPRLAKLVVVGNVDYDRQAYFDSSATAWDDPVIASNRRVREGLPAWHPLRGCRDEMYATRGTFESAFDDGDYRLLQGNRADELAVLEEAATARWLHVASHGFFRDQLLPYFAPAAPSGGAAALDSADINAPLSVSCFHPDLLAGIVLAGANAIATAEYAESGNDGHWTAMEVAATDLRSVDLAVLSACETGLGRFQRSEGPLSLQRAFHVAGVRSVVASLWEVDDASTQRLMKNFYENLWQKGMTKLAALQRAQLSVLRDEAPPDQDPSSDNRGVRRLGAHASVDGRTHPYYWAAFVLSGDLGPSQ